MDLKLFLKKKESTDLRKILGPELATASRGRDHITYFQVFIPCLYSTVTVRFHNNYLLNLFTNGDG